MAVLIPGRYLLKDAPPRELFPAVRAAARGEAVLSPSVATRVVGQVRAPVHEPVSQRELEVLELVARGASNREAASRLFISEATVKTHLMHIYAKLGVNDRAAAVATGYDRGLLIPAAPARRRPPAAAPTDEGSAAVMSKVVGALRLWADREVKRRVKPAASRGRGARPVHQREGVTA